MQELESLLLTNFIATLVHYPDTKQIARSAFPDGFYLVLQDSDKMVAMLGGLY